MVSGQTLRVPEMPQPGIFNYRMLTNGETPSNPGGKTYV
jgi:hypothetical protein